MYRVLYRKWRPQVFRDVVGQPQVTNTLAAEVRENRLAHAYLFTGSRGTGKTTCAKILSKAVNCLRPVNGDPCNECEICRGIDAGTVLDIVEIDAASNRGIDDIRALRDEANFTPAQAKFRVYIIDEVHMLTIEAFNALLKTLEEPPAHVKFILATTEVHKLPSTILSRCQRFDFRRIEPGVIATRLREIAAAENAVLEEDAALLIARIADGGMRDALSLLDRAIGVSANVTAAVVADSAGLMGRSHIYGLLGAIADRDTAKCLTLVDELHNASCDTGRLCVELTEQFRNFLMIKTVARPEDLIVCTADELSSMQALANRFSTEEILYALNVLTAASDAIKRTQNRRIEAEIAVIRLCTPAADGDLSALAARVAALERELAALRAGGVTVVPAPVERPAAPPPAERTPAPAPVEKTPPVEKAPAEEPPAFPEEPPAFPEEPPAFPEEPPVFPEEPPVFPEEPPVFPEDLSADGPLPFDEPPAQETQAEGQFSFGDTPPAADFSGFAAEGAPKNDFAARFAAEPAEDDDAFDFDAFMEEYGTVEKDGKRVKAPAAPVTENSLDPHVWVKIILDTERSFQPMIGLLTNSSAEIRGETLLVRPANPKVRFMLHDETLNRYLAPVAARILGKEYTVKLDV